MKRALGIRAKLGQFARYAAAGAIGTLVHYVVLLVLVELAAAGSVLASTLGALAGALVNYTLNYRYTFRSVRPHAESALKYLVVSVAGVLLNAVVIAAATSVLGLHYLVAQVLATAVVLVCAFAINRAWTF